jgi:3-hydroxyisobutyrate dehydrogenase-like beta-hydroxyacid dehydrogenase
VRPADQSGPTPYASFGVIGLGAMGGPVAGHVLAAGHPVVVLDLDGALVERYVARGARAAATPAELAASVDVVSIFVPSDDDVLDVCTGPDGVLTGARRPSLVLLCSSIRPQTCHAVAAAAPEGVDVMDAALTGGVRGAEAGTINLLAGGEEQALLPARHLLDSWTAGIHHLGPLGAGQVGKSVNNLIHWAQISAITEALELGRRHGLDVPTLRRALADGPTDSRTLRELELMRLTWHAKDLANAAVLADQVAMAMPVAEVSRLVMTQRSVSTVAALLTSPGDRDAPIHRVHDSDVAKTGM